MTLDHQPSDTIVSTAWLEAHLTDPDLRIFDCTTYLRPAEPGEDVPYHPESGRASYEQGHIPGAGFLDLPGELSDPTTKLRFMMPAEPQLAAAMSRHGGGRWHAGRPLQRRQHHVGDAGLVDAAGHWL